MANKGDVYERKLRRIVNGWDGCGSMRMPASGSATPFDMPDLLLTDGDTLYAGELKYTSNKYARFSKEEAKALIDFCTIWPAVPLFIGRFSQDTTFYATSLYTKEEVDELNDNDSFSMHRDERQKFPTIEDILLGESTAETAHRTSYLWL